jgi:hypothetical protein
MILQPSSAPWSPWDIGNYRWSEAFIWIAAVAGLLFGVFLFASYLYNRKRQLLYWAIAFFGFWVVYHQMIANGTYGVLVGSFATSMFGIPTALLVMLIPGLLAAGLLYDKDEKLGKIFVWVLLFLAAVYFVLKAEPNAKWFGAVAMGETRPSAMIAGVILTLVRLISGAMIIALPIMKEGRLGPKTMVSVGGILIFTADILWTLLMFITPSENTIDTVGMLFSFFFIGYVLCLMIGIANNKDWGFSLPHVAFEEL